MNPPEDPTPTQHHPDGSQHTDGGAAGLMQACARRACVGTQGVAPERGGLRAHTRARARPSWGTLIAGANATPPRNAISFPPPVDQVRWRAPQQARARCDDATTQLQQLQQQLRSSLQPPTSSCDFVHPPPDRRVRGGNPAERRQSTRRKAKKHTANEPSKDNGRRAATRGGRRQATRALEMCTGEPPPARIHYV